mgnify:CR=1 FL=1
MDKELGYLKCKTYSSDLDEKYYSYCRMAGIFFIVVRVRYGGADVEWDYACNRQHNALINIGTDVLIERFKELHEKYSTGYFSPERYGAFSHNGKIPDLTVESAGKLASELNIFLQDVLQQYERKDIHHGK